MRTRIAFGAGFALAAAFVFVFLQFRAEAIAQQAEATVQEVGAVSQLNEATAQQDGTIAQQAPSSEPLPVSADSTDPFAPTSPFSDSVEETSASYDLFESDAEPSELSPPVPESDDGDRKSSKRRKTNNSELDPFGSYEESQAEAVEEFGFDTGSDGFAGGSFDAESTKQPPLRIIRFRNVRANDIRSIIRGLFSEEADKQRWFLATEDQSNSLICKVPTDKFEQIKRLSEGLDRLAATGVDVGKKTQSWPIPHVLNDEPIGDPGSNSSQWTIRIVRLRFVRANDFNSIARDLALRQNRNSKLQLDFEPTTNTVVMRGPLAEINQVEQLAQQLDQPAAGAGTSAETEAMYGATPTRSSEFLDFNRDSQWETLQPPADKARQLREQVALIDQESVQMSNEVRLMQKHYSSQHPKFKSARKNLLTLLEEAFEKRLQLQGIEVALLSSRLREIESRVQQRAQLRQQIIDRRLHELLGEKDDLSWDVVRTAPVAPSRSLDDLLPPPDYSPDDSTDGTTELVQKTPYGDDELTQLIPETNETTTVPTAVDPGLPQQPETANPLLDEPAPGFIAQPEPATATGVVDRILPGELLENPQAQNPLTSPSRNESTKWQRDLIVAENTVATATVKVAQIKKRLSRMKGSDQEEDLEYELRLAELALDQARKLLEQKHRWIVAQRNSHAVNIRYLEKSLELAKTEYEVMAETFKKVTGTVPTSELRRQELEIQKAELRLEQAEADLDVFEVENRKSRTSVISQPTRQVPTLGVPAAKNKPALPETRLDSGNGMSRDSVNKVPSIEPGVPLPEANVPLPSSPDEALPGPST